MKSDKLDKLLQEREEALIQFLFPKESKPKVTEDDLRSIQSNIWYEVAQRRGTVPESVRKVLEMDGTR